MILSHLHRFIFIKGLKVAGTSVEIALSAICGPEDIVSPITPIDELTRLCNGSSARNYSSDRAAEVAYLNLLRRTAVSELSEFPMPAATYFNHMGLCDVIRLQGPEILKYQILAVERNPYAKIISWANHKLSFDAYKAGGAMRSNWHDLKEFLDLAIQSESIIAVRNIARYRGPDGSIRAHVMRFESLNHDFEQVIRSLGTNFPVALPHVKKGLLANDIDPRDLLDKKQIAAINELFAEEFVTFDYQLL